MKEYYKIGEISKLYNIGTDSPFPVILPYQYGGCLHKTVHKKKRKRLYLKTLPDSLSYVDDFAFGNCESLETVNFPDKLSDSHSRRAAGKVWQGTD